MKKTLLLIITFVLIVCMMILSKFNEYKQNKAELDEFNLKYEQYLNKEILGTDITTIINQAVDDNEKSFIKKENGKYIQDDEKSVNIEVKITELEEQPIYSMETLYNGGMSQFAHYYGQMNFTCTTIQYNTLGRVKYMLFEQIVS